MIHRLQQILARINWRYVVVCLALLLLSGCGAHSDEPDNGGISCWPCAVYVAAFSAIEHSIRILIAGDANFDGTCQYALMFLGLGLLFWIMFHTTKTIIIPIQEPDIRKFMLPLITVLFKAILVSSLIFNADWYIDLIGQTFVQPILGFFADISSRILDNNEVISEYATPISVSDLWGESREADSGLFGHAVQDEYLRIISRLYMALKSGISLGFAIWREAGFIPFIFGLLIILTFWGISLTLPMSFLDAFFRIGAMLVLSPFCFVGWVFPPTKKWVKKLWGSLLGAGMTVMFTCIYLSLTAYVLRSSAEATGVLIPAAQRNDPALADAVENLSVGMIGFFVLTLSMAKFGSSVPKLANSFGAETVNSSWTKAFGTLKKLSIAAGKAALAVALASPTLAKSAASEAAGAAKSVASDAKK